MSGFDARRSEAASILRYGCGREGGSKPVGYLFQYSKLPWRYIVFFKGEHWVFTPVAGWSWPTLLTEFRSVDTLEASSPLSSLCQNFQEKHARFQQTNQETSENKKNTRTKQPNSTPHRSIAIKKMSKPASIFRPPPPKGPVFSLASCNFRKNSSARHRSPRRMASSNWQLTTVCYSFGVSLGSSFLDFWIFLYIFVGVPSGFCFFFSFSFSCPLLLFFSPFSSSSPFPSLFLLFFYSCLFLFFLWVFFGQFQ